MEDRMIENCYAERIDMMAEIEKMLSDRIAETEAKIREIDFQIEKLRKGGY
jgi:deoxyribose-phosphate aldolase